MWMTDPSFPENETPKCEAIGLTSTSTRVHRIRPVRQTSRGLIHTFPLMSLFSLDLLPSRCSRVDRDMKAGWVNG